jgi:hypothetical protein
MWVAIHMCMEVMLGISLYNYLYLKQAKKLSFLLSLMLSLQQKWRTRGWNRFCPEAERGVEEEKEGEVTQIMYIHVNKCKNDKMKERKKFCRHYKN